MKAVGTVTFSYSITVPDGASGHLTVTEYDDPNPVSGNAHGKSGLDPWGVEKDSFTHSNAESNVNGADSGVVFSVRCNGGYASGNGRCECKHRLWLWAITVIGGGETV